MKRTGSFLGVQPLLWAGMMGWVGSLACTGATGNPAKTGLESPPLAVSNDSVPAGAGRYLRAYPDQIRAVEGNYLVWQDGTKMPFDDGRKKTFQGLLDSADLEDQVNAMPYPALAPLAAPGKNQDPGRVRYEPFFRKMYGETEAQVKANLVEIDWLPRQLQQKIRVSRVNGVAQKLAAISAELDQHPEWAPFLKDPGGTFTWRRISGTERLSTHSFGITIDINTGFSNYWQWDYPEWKTKGETLDLVYNNRIPAGIVYVFEKYGFVWGGRWFHYDTMHFEYRPELF
jgi:peptidoglycan LD-endopeptidase CwlK